MRLFYQNIVRDPNGVIISNATINVYKAGTTTAVNIYDTPSSSTPLSSLTTDSAGSFSFYVDALENGSYQTYKIVAGKSDLTDDTYTKDNVTIEDVYLGTYTVSTAVTSSYAVKIPNGVLYVKSGSGSVTFNGPVEIGNYQVFSGFSTGITFGYGAVKEVYPEWWGAKGDNSTDCYQAIVSANASISTYGGLVRFSSGTYLSQTRGIIIPGSVSWKGSGKGATTIKAGDSATTAGHFVAVRGTHVDITDLTMDGNGAVVPGAYPTGGSTLELDGNGYTTQHVRVANCRFYKNRFATIGASGPGSTGTGDLSNVIIDSNDIENAEDTGIAFVEYCHDITIQNNRVKESRYGISVDGTHTTDDNRPYQITITGNHIWSGAVIATTNMIDAQNARGIVITNNMLHMGHSNLYGIRCYNTAIYDQIETNSIIFEADSLTNVYGIQLDGSADGNKNEPNVIRNNSIYTGVGVTGPVGVGIFAYEHDACLSNNIFNNLVQGILLNSNDTVRNYLISGNQFYGCSNGYYEQGTYTTNESNVSLINNYFVNSSTKDIVLDTGYITNTSKNIFSIASIAITSGKKMLGDWGVIGGSTEVGNADLNPIVEGTTANLILSTTTITADRYVYIDDTALRNIEQRYRIVRTSAGAFNLKITVLPATAVKDLATNEWAEIAWNGSGVVLTAFGSL